MPAGNVTSKDAAARSDNLLRARIGDSEWYSLLRIGLSHGVYMG